MVFLWFQGRRGTRRRQAGRPSLALAGLLAASIAGCGNKSVSTPVDWWHDLQGGVIAARRPAPPGADLPYPHMGPIPERPAEPDKAARAALLDQLASERDSTQRAAARNPIAVLPPPPLPASPKPVEADDQTANASLPAAEAPQAPKPVVAAPGGPVAAARGGPVIIAGSGDEASDLPPIAETPPPPATFEGVAAEPLPTPPPPLAARATEASGGEHVLFATGQATLAATQLPTLKDLAGHRHGQIIAIEGHGEAVSDTPEGQEAAIALGLKRAQVIADALMAQHVPQTALRLSADAFGRGASVRVGS